MCHMAAELENQMPELLGRVNSGGHSLVRDLAAFLCSAREMAWVQVKTSKQQKHSEISQCLGVKRWRLCQGLSSCWRCEA